jgi:hypothetical protein
VGGLASLDVGVLPALRVSVEGGPGGTPDVLRVGQLRGLECRAGRSTLRLSPGGGELVVGAGAQRAPLRDTPVHSKSPCGDGQRTGHEHGRPTSGALSVLERLEQVSHRGPARILIDTEPALDDTTHASGHAYLRRPGSSPTLHDRRGVLHKRVTPERELSAQHLPGHHAEAELVGRRTGGVAAELLGSHVGGGTQHGPGTGEAVSEGLEPRDGARVAFQRRDALLLLDSREAEVHHANAAVVADHDVLGLEVAVQEPDVVGCDHASSRAEQHVENLRPGSGRRRAPGLERLALDELHGHPDAPSMGPDVVNRDDVGVLQLGQRLGLAQQSCPMLGGSLAFAGLEEQLEGDLAVELGIVCGVDHPHAPGAQATENHVAPQHGPPLQRRIHLGWARTDGQTGIRHVRMNPRIIHRSPRISKSIDTTCFSDETSSCYRLSMITSASSRLVGILRAGCEAPIQGT